MSLVSLADYYTLQERKSLVSDASAAADKLKTGIELQMKKHDRIYEVLQRLMKQEQYHALECQDRLEVRGS
eukprot:m.167947 g.167947  ORF g.167947 m.167947 type:complete len:71 (-) comp16646_c0_seq8:204-416(-)